MKKYILGISITVIAVFAFIALLPLEAFFQGSGEAQKLSNGETMTIEVELPGAYGEKISSLQLSLAVTDQDGNPAAASVMEKIESLTFSPDKAVSSKTDICEQRYDKNSGMLDIYIAGIEGLFSEDDKLTIGSIAASMDAGADVYVKLAEDSFQIVKGFSMKTITDEQNAVIRLGVEGGNVTPTEPVVPTEPVIPTEPANTLNDTSDLLSALDTAGTLQESDYTPESFALLKKAIEEAMAVLNNPNATQEEIDRAAEAVLNAMGTLVRVEVTSAGQTVTKTENNGKILKEAAPTGDQAAIAFYFIMIMVSAVSFSAVLIRKRRQNV